MSACWSCRYAQRARPRWGAAPWKGSCEMMRVGRGVRKKRRLRSRICGGRWTWSGGAGSGRGG